jgi:hypothetical protein
MHTCMKVTLTKLSYKSDTAAAIHCWLTLTCYVDDGQLEVDNNPASPIRMPPLLVKHFPYAKPGPSR